MTSKPTPETIRASLDRFLSIIMDSDRFDPDDPSDDMALSYIAEAPAMLEALRKLVAADNCNYSREAMRHEGYFAAARAILARIDGGAS